MQWFKKHWKFSLSAIMVFLFFNLPQVIDSYWDLFQKIHEVNVHVNWWNWISPMLPTVGLLLIMVLYVWRTFNQNEESPRIKTNVTPTTDTALSSLPTITQEDYDLLKSYKSDLAYDKYHLGERLILGDITLSYSQHDLLTGGILEFQFQVFNGSLLRSVKVGYVVDGTLKIKTMALVIKPDAQPTYIPHGGWGSLLLTQAITPEMVKWIMTESTKDEGLVLKIDFQGVHIFADDADNPLNYKQPQNALNLPKRLKCNIKAEIKENFCIYDSEKYELVPDE